MNLFVLDLGFSGRSFAALIAQTKTTLANWTQVQAQPKKIIYVFTELFFLTYSDYQTTKGLENKNSLIQFYSLPKYLNENVLLLNRQN